MKIHVFDKCFVFYWLLGPFMCQNHFSGPFSGKYWWHTFKSWILGRKISFITDFLQWLKNEEKIMICTFFKFSILKHFWSLKLIAWIDFRVVLVFYSFQVIWVDLNDEFEKWTKYSKKLINTEISRHLIWWYFCLFFLMIDWNWLPPPQTPPPQWARRPHNEKHKIKK